MAIINCPECGKEISDKAASCPSCGCPIESKTKNRNSKNVEKEIVLMSCKPATDAYFFPIGIMIISFFFLFKIWIIGMAMIAISILWILSINSKKISISNYRICAEKGILTKVKLNTPLSMVSSVTVTTGVFARSSNYGTIKITCAEGIFIFEDMSKADEFVNVFNKTRGTLDWNG